MMHAFSHTWLIRFISFYMVSVLLRLSIQSQPQRRPFKSSLLHVPLPVPLFQLFRIRNKYHFIIIIILWYEWINGNKNEIMAVAVVPAENIIKFNIWLQLAVQLFKIIRRTDTPGLNYYVLKTAAVCGRRDRTNRAGNVISTNVHPFTINALKWKGWPIGDWCMISRWAGPTAEVPYNLLPNF